MYSIEQFKEKIAKEFQIQFKNENYLKEALTHSSYANEHKECKGIYNERIEFLGDAVLELFISNWLYRQMPTKKEGELTKLRAQIVCEESLSTLAKECELDKYLLLGKGERASKGHENPAVLCDVFEAFVGAIYLDQGFEGASQFLTQVIISKMKDGRFTLVGDFKTELQEYFQRNGNVNIRYELLKEEGPSHARFYTVQVHVNEKCYEIGEGKTKKAAEQLSAKRTLEKLNVIS